MTVERLAEPKRLLHDRIASTMTDRGVPARLANRIAFQLVLKCEPADLGSPTTWQAMADQVHAEVEHLRQLGLVDRQIVVALPKLAATQIDALLDLPLAQSTVSEHLRILRRAGLVRANENGPRVSYCIVTSALKRLKALLGAV